MKDLHHCLLTQNQVFSLLIESIQLFESCWGVYIGNSLTEEEEEHDDKNNIQDNKTNNLKTQRIANLVVTKDGKEWFWDWI